MKSSEKNKKDSAKRYPNCGQKCPLADFGRINYFARKWKWKFFDRYPDIGESIFPMNVFHWDLGWIQGNGS